MGVATNSLSGCGMLVAFSWRVSTTRPNNSLAVMEGRRGCVGRGGGIILTGMGGGMKAEGIGSGTARQVAAEGLAARAASIFWRRDAAPTETAGFDGPATILAAVTSGGGSFGFLIVSRSSLRSPPGSSVIL